jgi:hypothetical protein
LAVGLLTLCLVGLNQHATGWLTWLDGVGALFGFAIAAGALSAFGAGGSIALAIGLGVLWLVGLAQQRESWLVWWTFAFACAYLVLAIAAGTSRRGPIVTRTHPRPV